MTAIDMTAIDMAAKPAAPRQRFRRDRMQTFRPGDTVDAVVIGSGAGGSPLAARLAAAGLTVVVLEAGNFWKPEQDFAADELDQRALLWPDTRLWAGAPPASEHGIAAGFGVGGSTLIFGGCVPRPLPRDFRLRSEFGVGNDWPIGYDELEPYYEEVEQVLGVSGPSPFPWGAPRGPYPMPPLPLNAPAHLMQRGCAELGIRTAPAATAALSRDYQRDEIGWRQACNNRGLCTIGCSRGSKGSMDVTFVPMAIAAGAEVRSRCFATGLEMGADHAVRSVVYSHDAGEEHQRCRQVFLCAGAVETPRLLLRADVANAGGQVGRNLLAQSSVRVWGSFEALVRPYKGVPAGLVSQDMYRPESAGFAGGYLLHSMGVTPVAYAFEASRHRGLWGAALASHMDGYNHVAGIGLVGDCLPTGDNRLELAEETDERGLAMPRVRFRGGDNELRLMAHGDDTLRSIWAAAGAKDIWGSRGPAFLAGTCRMSHDEAEGVVDANGRAFGVPNLTVCDASVLPSALSVGHALTIMALSLRTADRFLAGAAAARRLDAS